MPSRIATSRFFSQNKERVTQNRAREAKTGEMAATQKRIVRPSDDPKGWELSKAMKDELAVKDKLSQNADLAKHYLGATEDVLSSLQDFVQKGKEIALTASDDLSSGVAKPVFQHDAEILFGSVMQALNMRYGNRTLLGGHLSRQDAFDPKSGEFKGNSGKIEIEVARDHRVAMNVDAERAILGVGLKEGVNIVSAFERLKQGLELGDQLMVRSTLEDFGRAIDQLSIARGEIGARMEDLDRNIDVHQNETISRKEFISKIEEVDPVVVFSELAKDQTILKSTMETTRKLLQEVPPDILLR